MNKFLLTGILAIGLPFAIHAQSFEWAKQFGGTNNEVGVAVKTDANGNVYTLGHFQGTVDFDPGAAIFNLTAAGSNYDIFLTKVDASGNFVWAKHYGSTDQDFAVSMTVDKNDNVICSGIFAGTVDFDAGAGTHNMTSTSSGESFILKLDAAGNFLWATQRAGASGYDRNNEMKTDSAGNIYTSGILTVTRDFDPGPGTFDVTAIGSYDAVVTKFNQNGNLIWVKQMGGTGAQTAAYGMDVDPMGNTVITGMFMGKTDFNPSPAIADTVYITGSIYGASFVAKLDSAGNYIWAGGFSGNVECAGWDVVFDDGNNVIATGTFNGTVDFNPGAGTYNLTNSNSDPHGYVLKLDAAGNFIWTGSFGGTSGIYDHQVELDQNNDIYLSGRFESGIADFDPGAGSHNLAPVGSSDAFVVKLTHYGSFVYAKQFGGSSYENMQGFHIDTRGNIYLTGAFTGVADFDPDAPMVNLTPVAGYDSYTVKLGTCFMADDVSQVGTTLILNTVSGPVQWVDCGNGFSAVGGATNQSFTPALSGSYAVTVNFQTCVDTSDCYLVTISGIHEIEEGLISVYPNPTNELLNINSTKEIEKIFIYNSLGALVQTEMKNNFSVETLSPGMYIIQVKTTNGIHSQRFIKQ